MKMRFAIALLLGQLGIPGICIAQADDAMLFVPIPQGWDVGYQDRTSIGIVPRDETIEDWSNAMAIFVVDRQTADTATVFFIQTMQNKNSTCRGLSSDVLGSKFELEPGFDVPDPAAPTTLFVVKCPWSNARFIPQPNPEPYGEVGAYFVITGAEQLFVVLRAWRVPPFEAQAPQISPDELLASLERISDAVLCDVGTDTECTAAANDALATYTAAGDWIFQVSGKIKP